MPTQIETVVTPAQQPRSNLAGRTVLLADDDEAFLRALEVRCRHLGFRVERAGDGLRTLLKVSKEKPDLLILDLNLPDVDGFKVVERLNDPKFPPLPVIVLTARSDEAAIQRCKELGVLYVHKSACAWEELEPLIFDVFRDNAAEVNLSKPTDALPASQPTVLLVDDDPVVLKMLTAGMQKYPVRVIHASNGMQGFWLTLRERPDIVITDYNMPHGSGHYLLTRIKSTPATRNIPVIVFTGEALERGQRASIDRDVRGGRGQAAAFLTKPITASAIVEEIKRHIVVVG